ncbi:MAG: hypothetical protein V4459_10145 [Pseudomonadota bacterium]
MDATSGRKRLIPSFASWRGGRTATRIVVPIALVAGLGIGAIVALLFLIMPIGVLESMSVDSGIAALVAAAEPPLGLTARFAIAFLAALAVGGVTWFGLSLLIGARTLILNRNKRDDGVPVLRRADAHPDAPARRPVFANSDLGTPFLDVKADAKPMTLAEAMAIEPDEDERTLPADLDTPMASYLHPLDPPLPEPAPLPIVREPEPVAPAPIVFAAPEPEPASEPVIDPEPVVAVEPEGARSVDNVSPFDPSPATRFAPEERIETIELTPAVRATASIHDLLDRLEKGVAKKQPAPEPAPVAEDVPAEQSLEDTLDALRALARRVG